MSRTSASFIVLIACCSAALAQDKPYSVEARSRHYSLVIDVQPLAGDQIRYDATVTDLATSAVIMQPHLTTAARIPAKTESDNGDLHIYLRVGPMANDLSAELDIEKGGMVIDSIRSSWNITPRRARLRLPDTMRVGEPDVKAPIVIKRVEPVYNEQARKDRIAGIVILEVVIDKTGVVRDALLLKDLPDGLGQAAVDAARQWQFQPATLKGEPVNVIFNLSVSFKLDGVEPR